MARSPEPREDLIAEATALVPRAEMAVPGEAEPVVVGFRGEAASVYFGDDPAYHFTAAGALRRAFSSGVMLKAQSGRLVSLVRENRAGETLLHRREASADEQQEFLAAAAARLAAFAAAVAEGSIEMLRQAPEGAEAAPRIKSWLARLPCPLVVAERANVG